MTDLPRPLADPDLDVRELDEMPLNVRRLRDSSTAATTAGDAFRAAVLLWCASWHQVPAGSIPSNPRDLASLAGFGRDVASWEGVAAEALRGFVLCRDGRYYHQVIVDYAEVALAQLRAARRLSKANREKGKKSGKVRRALASRSATQAPGYAPEPAGALEFTHVTADGAVTAGLVEPAGNTGENATAESQTAQGFADSGTNPGCNHGSNSGSHSVRTAVPPPSPSLPSPPETPPPIPTLSSPSQSYRPSDSSPPVAGDLLDGVLPGGKLTIQRDSKTELPACPVLEIVGLYHEILPMCPRQRVLAEADRKAITTRWREDKRRQSLAWWRGYFEHVRDHCPFLVGQVQGRQFLASFGWLVGPKNFAKVVNGNYTVEREA